ncbi:MAG: SpoIIE family protein phosphatase [Anaerolineae bacterium]|nr:SpoIIE family protein phosphatase [Anaerolineae bacterium]
MPDPISLAHVSPDHLLTLYQITRAMNSSLDFDEVLRQAMDAVVQLTKAERGVLMIADDETGELIVRVAHGVSRATDDTEDAYSTTVVNQVVETRQALLTNNAMFDDRYRPGQSIIMRGLRAILCAPMLVKERLVGVVYVDTAMRTGTFSEADRDLLMAVAGQAGIAIENARLYAVAVEKGRLERELQMAREIQQALIPSRLPVYGGYELAATWQAAREMAGDFYDVFHLADGSLGVVIADVSDKGAGAALFMAVSRSFIRSYAYAGLSPVQTLSQANDLIVEDSDSGMFVTAYYSVFYPDGRCTGVNAGHNPPILYRHEGGHMEFLARGGRAIGWFKNNPLEAVEVELQRGDVLVYYTDGLTEAENEAGNAYGPERLEAVVRYAAEQSASAIRDAIVGDVNAFCGEFPLLDDLTLVVIRFTG